MPKESVRENHHEGSSSENEPNDGDVDEFVPNQASTSQASQVLSGEELQRKVDEVVLYMLIIEHKKLPIKRPDITKNVIKGNSKTFTQVFNLACKKMENIFGLKVTPIPNKTNMWILVNNYSDLEGSLLIWSRHEYSRCGFLMILLSIIFMTDNVIAENKLWQILEKMGIEQDKVHPVLGDVKKLIMVEFVRQMYIEITRPTASENPTAEFRWGPRAILEVSKKSVFDFVCKLYGNDTPHQWTAQYQEVQRAENPGL